MPYFLTVTKRDGSYLHHRERYPDLQSAIAIVSREYLTDAAEPHRWNGYFAVRGGQLTRLYLNRATAGLLLRDDIERIDIVNERGLLETATWERGAVD
jgi:hypothetical protein